MKLLRNPEAARDAAIYAVISVIASVLGFTVGVKAGVVAVCICVCFTAAHFFSSHRRYAFIAHLTAEIDSVLHGCDGLSFDGYDEGELAVLACELQKMTATLREQRNRLTEDKVFLADSIADISHQIRTPLTAINLTVSLLSEQNVDEKRRRELCRELKTLLSRIDWLITSLLKMSKIDAGTVNFVREKTKSEELMRFACEPFLIQTELRDISLDVHSVGDIVCDVKWTAEAVGNILKNCIEHSRDNSVIELRACENALFSEIIISDCGGGIAKEDLPHIFERFYRGQSLTAGFGIGLALARMIIVGQDGTIKAENTAEGARFTVRFYKSTV